MKFLKENWFKLMTGTSMLVFSFAFLMYAVSPSYANETNEKKDINQKKPNYTNQTNYLIEYNGYLYSWRNCYSANEWAEGDSDIEPHKRKLP